MGSLFCSECGALLIDHANAIEKIEPSSHASGISTEVIREDFISPSVSASERLVLYLVNCGKTLSLLGRREYTLGRITEEQSTPPDIDLNPYGAYECGVSRLHAVITTGANMTIMDMGSINGTQVNGKPIPTLKPCPIVHGDVLALGKLKIQVLRLA